MVYFLIAIVIVALIAGRFRRKNSSSISLTPKVLFLKLGNKTADFFEEDIWIYPGQKMAVDTIVATNLNDVSNCLDSGYNIVHVYTKIDNEGKLSDLPERPLMGDVLNLIYAKGGVIAIIATDNLSERYISGNKTYKGNMNVVMTLDRKEGAFVAYFKLFFAELFGGKKMSDTLSGLTGRNSQSRLVEAPDTVMILGNTNVNLVIS